MKNPLRADDLGDTASSRVFRGGYWYYDPDNLRSAGRGSTSPTYRSSAFGFRLFRSTEKR